VLNRQGAKNAKGFFYCLFLIGTDDQEKHNALRAGGAGWINLDAYDG
jgi:hypothetical protein